MKWIPLILIALAGCQASLKEDSLLPFSPLFLSEGLTRTEVLELLGSPADSSLSAFGRESWVYSPLECQITYCNTRGSGIYLFPGPSRPQILHLLFDETGRLASIAHSPFPNNPLPAMNSPYDQISDEVRSHGGCFSRHTGQLDGAERPAPSDPQRDPA